MTEPDKTSQEDEVDDSSEQMHSADTNIHTQVKAQVETSLSVP